MTVAVRLSLNQRPGRGEPIIVEPDQGKPWCLIEFGFRDPNRRQAEAISGRQLKTFVQVRDGCFHLGKTRDSLFAERGEALGVYLLIHRRYGLPVPLGFCPRDATGERAVEVGIEGLPDDVAQDAGLQGGERIDLRLFDAEGFPPAVGALLGFLQWCGRKPELAHLLNLQRDRHEFEFQIMKLKVADCLQLAPDGYRHLVAGRIAVREGEDHQRTTIGDGFLGDAINVSVADLARVQVEVGVALLRDRLDNIFKACLLAEDRKLVCLPCLETGGERRRLEILDRRDPDIDADIDAGRRRNPCLAEDERLFIAVVDDALERNIAEPARRLAGDGGEPIPIVFGITKDLAVRLPDIALGDDCVMEPAPVNSAGSADSTIELFGKPSAITMTGGSV
jgi:hypothetical protein